MRNWYGWLAVSGVVIVLDQLTKQWVVRAFGDGGSIAVTPFFNLVLVYNKGAAFSLLSSASGWQRAFFATIAVVASAAILYLLRRQSGRPLLSLALSLILGGALGNLWDRLMLGHVVDFLDFYYRSLHWPAFNVADAAITCGAALLIWDSFRRPKVKK
jgi:signal peptidase II